MLDPSNNRVCIDINECEMWNECDQSCTNTIGSYTCQCEANYTLQANGHCKHIDSKKLSLSLIWLCSLHNYSLFIGDNVKIMFSTGSKIFESNNNGQNIRQIYENNDFDIISMDYNFMTKTFYFVDGKKSKVRS